MKGKHQVTIWLSGPELADANFVALRRKKPRATVMRLLIREAAKRLRRRKQ